HLGIRQDGAAALRDERRHPPRDAAIVGDAAGRDEEGADTAYVRFAPRQFLGVEALDRQAVLDAALLERRHAGHFEFVGRDQQLAASVEGKALFLAEADGRFRAGFAEPRLEAA